MAIRRPLIPVLAILVSPLIILTPPASAVGDKDCGDFASQKAAQIFYLNHGGPQSDPHGLDSEGDGIACESNPAPYYYGTSLPDEPKPEPKPQQVKTSVDFDLSTSKAIQGEKVRLSASVTPTTKRTVLFQRRKDGRWRTFVRDASNLKGLATSAIRAPKSSSRYRAVVLKKQSGNKIYLGATSRDRSLTVQVQRVVLELSRSWIPEGDWVRATVRATPVRKRRPVVLQIRRGDTWRTLDEGRQSSRGVASFRLHGDAVGTFRLRAIVSAWRGAIKGQSRAESLEVRDVEAPDAPLELAALPGDGSVDLTWSSVVATDLHYYRVWYRAATEEPWLQLGTTPTTSLSATGLMNDTTYWFTVQAVDRAGNSSALAAEVQATPVTPPVAP